MELHGPCDLNLMHPSSFHSALHTPSPTISSQKIPPFSILFLAPELLTPQLAYFHNKYLQCFFYNMYISTKLVLYLIHVWYVLYNKFGILWYNNYYDYKH